MTILQKDGATYIDMETQEAYKADSVFNVIAHIINNDKSFTQSDNFVWTVSPSLETPWVSYKITFKETLRFPMQSRPAKRVLTIIKEL